MHAGTGAHLHAPADCSGIARRGARRGDQPVSGPGTAVRLSTAQTESVSKQGTAAEECARSEESQVPSRIALVRCAGLQCAHQFSASSESSARRSSPSLWGVLTPLPLYLSSPLARPAGSAACMGTSQHVWQSMHSFAPYTPRALTAIL